MKRTCRKKYDLTTMNLKQLVRFSLKAIQDYPPQLFRQGMWIRVGDGSFSVLKGRGRKACRFTPQVTAKEATVCAVGAVLASDGPKAAWDWLMKGDDDQTANWAAGRIGGKLLWAVSDRFESTRVGYAQPEVVGRRRAISLLKRLARIRSTARLHAAVEEAWDSGGV